MFVFNYTSHRRHVIFSAVFCMLFFVFCELGDTPVAPPDLSSSKSKSDSLKIAETVMLSVIATPASLRQGYDSTALITAMVYNGYHNPVSGKLVTFTASDGIISANDTTDSSGRATAKFISSHTEHPVIIHASIKFNDSTILASATIDIIETLAIADSTNSNMRIRAFPSNLPAAFGEQSRVEVTVFDDNRNPLAGKEISFSTTKGTISGKGITDSAGIAQAFFYSEPVNGDAVVTGKMKYGDTVLAVATTITLSGIEVIITPELSSAPLNSIIPVVIKLLDGKGNPLPDNKIFFTGNGDSIKVTDGAGEIRTVVTRASEGYTNLHAYGLGASDSSKIYFGNTAPVDIDNTIRSLRLFSSHAQLRADNSAEAVITAIIISEDNHNPLVGDTVEFSSTLGIIDKYGITNESGRTTVILRSAPVNGTCVIRGVLKGNSAIKDSTSVLFSGITLTLSADRNDLRINDTAIITALLKDGSGNPISSDFVNFMIAAPGAFPGNLRLSQSTLAATGSAVIKGTSATAGKIMVHAVSANVADSIMLTFTTNNISVISSKKSLLIGGNDSASISATYVDLSGNAIAGKNITFATNAGTITSKTAVTNLLGVATTYLKSGFFATTATVQAKSADGSAYTSVEFVAAVPASISLAITPDNIGINGGVAELIATVKDDSGNVVSGAEVSFKITKGPGGGEFIDKPIIASTSDGIARGKILAGTLPSEYRGCEVAATVGIYTVIANLTISGEPFTITVSRPQDDTVVVAKAGAMDETTFEYFIGAVVKDVNGNPVADGTPVNFSSVVSGMSVGCLKFVRWEIADGDIKPIMDYRCVDIPFEDINGNFKYDPEIDLNIDNIPGTASRGDNRKGDINFDYNSLKNILFWDFNGNLKCDTSSSDYNGEPVYVSPSGDTLPQFFADLNQNGVRDISECPPSYRSLLPPEAFLDGFNYNFSFWQWEMRKQFRGDQLEFANNDFALVIDRTAVTKNGVAYTKITYPRQFALRLYATVNAEVKGLRDKNGERFVLPVIIQ